MVSEFEVMEVLNGLMGAYPSFTPKVEMATMVQAYQRALADQPPAAVRRAGAEILTSSKFFPSAHELREAAAKIVIELEGRGVRLCTLDDAGQRWQDEIYGFAPALLTRDPEPLGKWNAERTAEFARLMGKAPRKLVIDNKNRGIFEAYGRYVREHANEMSEDFETWEVCNVG